MNVAVVGSNGFIGGNLVSSLMYNKSIRLFLFGRNEKSVFENRIPYNKIDLNNTYEIIYHFKKIDFIYYLASSTIPANSYYNPKKEIEDNLIPFINFLECISTIGNKKIVFVSSAGTVYGNSNINTSENTIKNPINPYGINKLTMEYYLKYFGERSGLKSVIFRISNIYGENQNTVNGLGIINTFLENILSNKEVIVYGNGEITRNYIYVQDVVKILTQVLLDEFKTIEEYNLCSDKSLSINEIIYEIEKITDINFKITKLPNRKSDIQNIQLDNTKLKSKFNPNFTPITIGINNTFLNIKELKEPKIK